MFKPGSGVKVTSWSTNWANCMIIWVVRSDLGNVCPVFGWWIARLTCLESGSRIRSVPALPFLPSVLNVPFPGVVQSFLLQNHSTFLIPSSYSALNRRLKALLVAPHPGFCKLLHCPSKLGYLQETDSTAFSTKLKYFNHLEFGSHSVNLFGVQLSPLKIVTKNTFQVMIFSNLASISSLVTEATLSFS